MADKYDVIVVGAGPAGSIAAWKAAEGGAKTLLIDRMKLPRYKLCGGAVAGWVMKNFDIPEEVVENRGTRLNFCRPPKYKLEKFPAPTPQGLVLRDKFDYHFTKLAIKAGAELRDETRVKTVIKKSGAVGGVELVNGEKIYSDIVIGCDGPVSMTARTAGFWKKWFDDQGETWKEHMCFCVGVEMKMDKNQIEERLGKGNIYFFVGRKVAPLGYGWIFPKTKADLLSVGLGTFMPTLEKKPMEYMHYFLNEHPICSKLVEDADIIHSSGAYIPIKHVFRPSFDSGIMLAGDSCGMVNPVIGEGIFYCVRSGTIAGETAAEAVKEKDFSAGFLKRYEDRWEEKIGKHLDTQAQLFEEYVGTAMRKIEQENITDEDLKEQLFIENYMETFIGVIQYQTEYAFKKRGWL